MRSIVKFSTMLFASALAASCGGDGTSCGDGTIEQGGTCVPESQVVCGDGTSLVNGECVIEQSPAGTAPDLVALATEFPFPGGGFIELQGSGFNAADGGTVHVTIGGEEVDVYFVSDSRVVAQLPPASAIDVEVAISTDNGSDALPFEYIGLLAADGRCEYGSLHLIDPRNGYAAPLGPIQHDPGNGDPVVPYSVSGLAFASDGTLYGVAVCNDGLLLTIDPATGAATEVGPLIDGDEDEHSYVPDIAFLGSELYGWSESDDDLIRINTATGAVERLPSSPGSYGSGLEAYDANQLIAVLDGDAAPPYLVSTTGEATELENSLTGPLDDAICALAKGPEDFWGLYGDGHNGLLTVDFDTGVVNYLGPTAPNADGLVVPPGFAEKTARLANTTVAIRPEWEARLPASSRKAAPAPVPVATKPALAATRVLNQATATRGDEVSLQRYLARQGTALAGSATRVAVTANRDAAMELDAADVRAGRYVLRANQKGRVKLVDTRTNKTLARDVVEIVAR